MSDFELRRAQRRRTRGDHLDEARYLRAQLRRGTLLEARLRVAAALGHTAAREATGSLFSVPEPSPLRHWWRRKARNALNRLGRWTEQDEVDFLGPYTGDLAEWIQSLAPLGAPACVQLSRIVVEQVAHDWPTVVDCLGLAHEVRESVTAAAAMNVAVDLATRACRVRDPQELRTAIRDELVAWALDREPPLGVWPTRELDTRETEDAGPITKLANRVVEDAYSRGATQILIEPNAAPEQLSIFYDVKGERSERMRIPRSAGRPLVARYKYMAGLDVLETRAQQGAIRYERWGGKGLVIGLRVELEPAAGLQRCTLLF